jgi:hypothetical protein
MNKEIKEMIKMIRTVTPDQIAKDILSVQPMPSNAIKELYEHSMSEEHLKEEGYKPVSRMGLMWIKKEK